MSQHETQLIRMTPRFRQLQVVHTERLTPNMQRIVVGVFCAGEMLDWEAPTGGYLLTACYASGQRAAEGVIRWL